MSAFRSPARTRAPLWLARASAPSARSGRSTGLKSGLSLGGALTTTRQSQQILCTHPVNNPLFAAQLTLTRSRDPFHCAGPLAVYCPSLYIAPHCILPLAVYCPSSNNHPMGHSSSRYGPLVVAPCDDTSGCGGTFSVSVSLSVSLSLSLCLSLSLSLSLCVCVGGGG
eukprot:COSAG03_NODE_1229_length_4513_cov_3.752605_1_plen_168_part_00